MRAIRISEVKTIAKRNNSETYGKYYELLENILFYKNYYRQYELAYNLCLRLEEPFRLSMCLEEIWALYSEINNSPNQGVGEEEKYHFQSLHEENFKAAIEKVKVECCQNQVIHGQHIYIYEGLCLLNNKFSKEINPELKMDLINIGIQLYSAPGEYKDLKKVKELEEQSKAITQ